MKYLWVRTSGRSGGYSIPAGVTTVADSAFAFCPNLTSIACPGSITNLGQSAFSSCGRLVSVTLSEGLISIGSLAFASCTSLSGIAIPGSVNSIGSGLFQNGSSVFDNCLSLAAITVVPANAAYSSLEGVLFDKGQTRLVRFPAAKPGSYAIPGSVTNILRRAFAGCTSLTNLTIPGSNALLGDNAFESCTSLRSVVLLPGVKFIGGGTFGSCSNLSRVTLPNSVTTIAGSAFMNCFSLTNITLPASVTNVGQLAFFNCPNLRGLFFSGNRPQVASTVFSGTSTTVYYLPGRTGWSATFAGRPAVLWNPLMQTSGADFGVGSDGFGFNINGSTNIPIVIEATTDLASANWVALQSLNLTNGTHYFSDPEWTDHPTRVYRIRSP